MDDPYPETRQGIIEFVEMIDKLQRLSPRAAPQTPVMREFVEVLLQAVQQISERLAIRRLFGRVREASREEIYAAAAALIEIAESAEGDGLLESLQQPASEAGQPSIVEMLKRSRQQMNGKTSNDSSN